LRTKGKLVLVVFALIVASLAAFLLFLPKYLKPEFKKIGHIPYLTSVEIRNPEIALKYGIVGYVEISLAPDAPMSQIEIERGGEASITLLLHFVSHDPKVTEIQVNIDPNSGEGLVIEQSYVVKDTKGNIIERGVVNVNKFVSYNPSGSVTIKADQTLPVTLTIRIPTDFPSSISSFPLGAVGITANVPVLSDVNVMVYVRI